MYFPSLIEHARQYEAGNITASAIGKQIIANRRAHESYEQAYQTFDEEEILRQSALIDKCRKKCFLGGVAVSVKDAYGVTGYPSYGGGPARLSTDWSKDSGIVSTLRELGVMFTGKTQMVEFALGGLGQNPHWGAPSNPWDETQDRVCGGSSCGAGVSLWDGTAMVALAADIAGSVRVPASMSGVVGFRPTQGQWRFGHSYLNICPTLDGPGILTLSVEDAFCFYLALKDPGKRPAEIVPRGNDELAGVKIGYSQAIFELAQADIADVVFKALSRLADAGAKLVESPFPEYREAYDLYMSSGIGAIECAAFVKFHFGGSGVIYDPAIRNRLESVRDCKAFEYLKSIHTRRRLIGKAEAHMQHYDVIAMPTLPISPPTFDEIADPSTYTAKNKAVTLMTNPVNILNLSSITMPAGKDDLGLPVGLQFAGRANDDERLLGIARATESLLGKPIDVLGKPARIFRR